MDLILSLHPRTTRPDDCASDDGSVEEGCNALAENCRLDVTPRCALNFDESVQEFNSSSSFVSTGSAHVVNVEQEEDTPRVLPFSQMPQRSVFFSLGGSTVDLSFARANLESDRDSISDDGTTRSSLSSVFGLCCEIDSSHARVVVDEESVEQAHMQEMDGLDAGIESMQVNEFGTEMEEQVDCEKNWGLTSWSEDVLPESLEVIYTLPTLCKPQIPSQAFRSIDGCTLAALVETLGQAEFARRYCLVDCRFPYEYHGGHIRTAMNIFDRQKLEHVFFPRRSAYLHRMKKMVPIFYCEFSQKRAPAMAHHLRAADRLRNESRYPHVDYPEIYVLDRGYHKFFEIDRFTAMCSPPAYVPMLEEKHVGELRHLSRFLSFGGLSARSLHRFSSIFGVKRKAGRRMRSAAQLQARNRTRNSLL